MKEMSFDKIKSLKVGDWVYIDLVNRKKPKTPIEVASYMNFPGYFRVIEITPKYIGTDKGDFLAYSTYGKGWKAWLTKQESEGTEMEINESVVGMANDLAKICPDLIEDSCDRINCIDCLANKLYKAGYRKQEQLLNSFVEKLIKNSFEVSTHEFGRISVVDEEVIESIKEDMLEE